MIKAKTRSSVIIGSKELKPAPFVSTSYEYSKSGQYVIGGVLIVTLEGTVVGEDIIEQMNELSALQSSQDCITLIIGCQGSADFLSGAGRVRSVQLSASDQPFVATYSIIIGLENIIAGQKPGPAVDPDPEFLIRNCLTQQNARYIKSYSEKLSFEGDGDTISLVDNELGLSKAYVKAKGEISVMCYGRNICGEPDFNGTTSAINMIKERASALMSLTFCGPDENPLAVYSGWNKWLDTKSLDINDAGSVVWKFDLYMAQGSCAPFAWSDINVDDKINLEFKPPRRTRTISGSIKGLSLYTGNFLNNNIGNGERYSNALSAFGKIVPKIISGSWPGLVPNPVGEMLIDGETPTTPLCEENDEPICYQRISSSVSSSVVAGEITFSAEFADISTCKSVGPAAIDVTVEESLPAIRHQEFIIPNRANSIIHYIGDKPHTATVTVRGTLQGCDTGKINEVIRCVDNNFNQACAPYNGWLIKEESKTVSTYSYSRNKSFIRCR